MSQIFSQSDALNVKLFPLAQKGGFSKDELAEKKKKIGATALCSKL